MSSKINAIRRIPARKLDLYGMFRDTLEEETFCETEALIREAVDQVRVMVHAGRQAGLNVRAYVDSLLAEDAALPGNARLARVTGHFAGGERGARIGATAGKQMIEDANRYASNYVRGLAPWLSAKEPEDDDA